MKYIFLPHALKCPKDSEAVRDMLIQSRPGLVTDLHSVYLEAEVKMIVDKSKADYQDPFAAAVRYIEKKQGLSVLCSERLDAMLFLANRTPTTINTSHLVIAIPEEGSLGKLLGSVTLSKTMIPRMTVAGGSGHFEIWRECERKVKPSSSPALAMLKAQVVSKTLPPLRLSTRTPTPTPSSTSAASAS